MEVWVQLQISWSPGTVHSQHSPVGKGHLNRIKQHALCILQIPFIEILPIYKHTKKSGKLDFQIVFTEFYRLYIEKSESSVSFSFMKIYFKTVLNRLPNYQMMSNKDLFSFALNKTWKNIFPSFWLPLMRLPQATVKFFGREAHVADTLFYFPLKTKGIWISTWKKYLKSGLVTPAAISNWDVIADHISQLWKRHIRQNLIFWTFSF